MAYNRKYYLLRVKEVCEVFKLYHAKGYTGSWIYRNHIKERFHISKSTLDRYLGIPYERDLKRIQENETECNKTKAKETATKNGDF